MLNRSRGFTITELLVALGITGIMLGIAAPGFNDFRRNNRLTAAANDFLSATQIARTEAIKRQVAVSVCPTTDPSNAAAACSAGPFRSWLIFVDTDSNCARTGATEVIIKAAGPVATSLSAASNGDCASFAPTGFLQPQPITLHNPATHTVYCDTRGLGADTGQNQSAGRGIIVSNTGRSRVTRDVTSGATSDLSTWGDVACP